MTVSLLLQHEQDPQDQISFQPQKKKNPYTSCDTPAKTSTYNLPPDET